MGLLGEWGYQPPGKRASHRAGGPSGLSCWFHAPTPPADTTTLTARNKETAPLFNQVSAELIPQSPSKVKVQFKEFKLLGLLPVKAPPSAVGELEVTYLDGDLRVSRGNHGNLFVLQMQNRSVKP